MSYISINRGEELRREMEGYRMFDNFRVPVGSYYVVFLDGRRITNFIQSQGYKRPRDPEFKSAMVDVGRQLVNRFSATLAYTQSDEISLLLPPGSEQCGRRIEDIISETASFAGSGLTIATRSNDPIGFKGKTYLTPREGDVADFLYWRHLVAGANTLYDWCFYNMLALGKSENVVNKDMIGLDWAALNDLLFNQFEINFARDVPGWARAGVLLIGQEDGSIRVDEDPPIREKFRDNIEDLLQ